MDLLFNIPQLHEFIARTESIRPLDPARITFGYSSIHIRLGPVAGVLELGIISGEEPVQQALSMAQVCNQLSPLLSHVDQLVIREQTPKYSRRWNGIDTRQLFELFNPFPSLQCLHIHDELKPLAARVLHELTGERATEVLPTLRSLFFIFMGLDLYRKTYKHSLLRVSIRSTLSMFTGYESPLVINYCYPLTLCESGLRPLIDISRNQLAHLSFSLTNYPLRFVSCQSPPRSAQRLRWGINSFYGCLARRASRKAL